MLIIAAFLSLALSSAQNFDPDAACARYLGRELSLKDLLTTGEPGLAHAFPSVFMTGNVLVNTIELEPARLRRLTDATVISIGDSHGDNRYRNFVGPLGTVRSAPADALHERLVAHPHLRMVRPSWRDLNAIIPTASPEPIELMDVAIRVLPREWQRKVLMSLLEDLPPLLDRAIVERALAASEHTIFMLSPGYSRENLGRGRGLNPNDPRTIAGLNAILHHYFPGGAPYDEARLAEVFERHLTFRVVDPVR